LSIRNRLVLTLKPTINGVRSRGCGMIPAGVICSSSTSLGSRRACMVSHQIMHTYHWAHCRIVQAQIDGTSSLPCQRYLSAMRSPLTKQAVLLSAWKSSCRSARVIPISTLGTGDSPSISAGASRSQWDPSRRSSDGQPIR
jgi:hypothetical protein